MGNKGRDVNISYPVTIGKAEWAVTHIVAHMAKSAPGHRRLASVNQRDFPGFSFFVMYFHGVVLHVEGHITHVEEIIGKVFLDYIPFVATANHEFVNSVCAEDLENVPEDRFAADFYHGLWLKMSLFADAGP